MSGPKVARIRTHGELVMSARRQLASMDEAVKKWIRICDRKQLVTPAQIQEVQERRKQIHALMRSNEFRQIADQTRAETAYLLRDVDVRVEQAVVAEARARTGRRRVASAAATLIASLSRAEVQVPDDLLRDLEAAAKKLVGGAERAERALARAFALLAPEAPEAELTERQRQLAARLGEGESTATLSDWLAGRPPADDETGQRLDRAIAALDIEVGADVAVTFADRAAAIAVEPSPARRRLLADSLVIEIAATARERHELEEAVLEVRGLAAELEVIDVEAAENLRQRASQAQTNADVAVARSLIVEANGKVERARADTAAGWRRDAVLKALSSLGYEVREGMATAWSQNGRLALRKATQPDAGVEVSGSAADGRLQLRPVAFGSTADATRLRDIETTWCSDFGEMKERLANRGDEVAIEKATPVGAVAVKVIESPRTTDRRDVETPKIRQRRRDP